MPLEQRSYGAPTDISNFSKEGKTEGGGEVLGTLLLGYDEHSTGNTAAWDEPRCLDSRGCENEEVKTPRAPHGHPHSPPRPLLQPCGNLLRLTEQPSN